MYNILVVDDDMSYFEVIRDSKIPECKILYANDLSSMQETLKHKKINLILMDWDLGKDDGVDITKQLKSDFATHSIPIIIVSGQMLNEKMIFALNQGADDYICKPFNVDFLTAKINSNLRKYGTHDGKIWLKNIVIDPSSFSISIKGENRVLPKKEFLILNTLLNNPERAFSREELNQIDCPGYSVGTRTVDVLINRIRSKYEPVLGFELIHTLYKKGYKINKKVF